MPANLGKKHTRPLVTVIGFGALILGFAAFSILPFWRRMSTLDAEIGNLRQRIAETDSQVRTLKALQSQSQLIQHEVRNYDRLVPASQDLGPFLEQLSRELDNAGLKDSTKQVLPATVLGKCQQLPIEIRGTGTFAQFRQFLLRLEELPRMSSVSKLTIETADPAMTGKVAVDLTLVIYNTKPAS
jgi:Tfp pilus assembly protein PilO